MTQRVFVDANVLFSKTLTDWLFLLRLENSTMFQTHTTEDVIAETIANMRKRNPTAPGSMTRHRGELIRRSIDEILPDYPGGDGALKFSGKDPDDYHVHAAATAAHADFLLTCNAATDVTTTPDDECYTVIHPDDFFCLVASSNRDCVTAVSLRQIGYWKHHCSRMQLDDALRNAGCFAFAGVVHEALREIGRNPQLF